MNVGFRERDADVALLRELARLRERGGRESDGGNVEALLREPDAIAAFAAGDRQRAADFGYSGAKTFIAQISAMDIRRG